MREYLGFENWVSALIVAGIIVFLAQSQDRKNMGCTSGLLGLAAAIVLTGVYRLVAGHLEGRLLLIFSAATLILEVTMIGFFATFAVNEGGRDIERGEGAGVGMIAGAWTGLGIGLVLSPVSLLFLYLVPLLGLVLGSLFGAAARGRKYRLTLT